VTKVAVSRQVLVAARGQIPMAANGMARRPAATGASDQQFRLGVEEVNAYLMWVLLTLEWHKAGTGRLGHGMVFLTVKLTNGDDPGRLVRVELTEHRARELAGDLVNAADGSLRGTLW